METPLRIIQVVNVRWFNATAWYALFLSRLLKEAGHDVLLIALPGTETFHKAQKWGLNPLALNVNTCDPFSFMKLSVELRKIIKEFSPHLVNCHRGENFVLWCFLRQFFPFALVRTLGDQRPQKSFFVNRILHKYFCDVHIATNSSKALELTQALRCPEVRVRTILGGVDSLQFQYDAQGRDRVRAELGIAADSFVLGFLGRFDPVKGLFELIKSVGEWKARQGSASRFFAKEKFNLLLVGFPAGLALEEIHQWLKAAKLLEQTVITGKRNDVAACISAMDAGVVASRGSEAIARAAFEMMSCGVPLIGTQVGVLPDILPPWALASVQEEDALGALIEQVIENGEFRASLKEAALSAMANLSEEDFLKQTSKAYLTALNYKKNGRLPLTP